MHAVLQGQVHGCPYKTFDKGSLTVALTKLRIQPQAVQEAVSKAQGGHYQLACAAAWEGAHGCSCDTGINHPNQVRHGTTCTLMQSHNSKTVFCAKVMPQTVCHCSVAKES